MVGAYGTQGDHLVDGRGTGRDGEPVAVGMGERATGREAQAAGLQ